MRVSIRNTSDFPTRWVELVVDWITRKQGFVHGEAYTVVVRKTSRGHHGYAAGRRTSFACQRRGAWRSDCSYSRREEPGSRMVATPLESFVWIAAHELFHLSPDGKRNYEAHRTDGGHRWRDRMEIATQNAAAQILDAYRDGAGATLLAAYARSLRTERAKARRAKARRMALMSPDARLERIEELMRQWEAKAARAERALAKLRRRRSAILAAQKRAASRARA